MTVLNQRLKAGYFLNQLGQLHAHGVQQRLALGGRGRRRIAGRTMQVVVLHMPAQFGAFAVAQQRKVFGTLLGR